MIRKGNGRGRPKRTCIVAKKPRISGYAPIQETSTLDKAKTVLINLEEYEALRLCDYENHNQVEAAEWMGISRPTFTRIYQNVRRKIAIAFVEGQNIIFAGGKVQVDAHWMICNCCNAKFNSTSLEKEETHCPLCNSSDLAYYNQNK